MVDVLRVLGYSQLTLLNCTFCGDVYWNKYISLTLWYNWLPFELNFSD
jgi:hypothetical protein